MTFKRILMLLMLMNLGGCAMFDSFTQSQETAKTSDAEAESPEAAFEDTLSPTEGEAPTQISPE